MVTNLVKLDLPNSAVTHSQYFHNEPLKAAINSESVECRFYLLFEKFVLVCTSIGLQKEIRHTYWSLEVIWDAFSRFGNKHDFYDLPTFPYIYRRGLASTARTTT